MSQPDLIVPGDIVATTKMLTRPGNFGGPALFPGTLGEVLAVHSALARVDFRAFNVRYVRLADLRLAGSSAIDAEYESYLEAEVARLEKRIELLQQILSDLTHAEAPRLERSWNSGA